MPQPSKKPKKLLRQRLTEENRGEGANPSQLGDPISLEVETNPVPPADKGQGDPILRKGTRNTVQPSGSSPGKEGRDNGNGEDTGSYERRMENWDITGKAGARGAGLSESPRELKL